MATRNLAGDARADHGAQFFTTRSDQFKEAVDRWISEGFAREWCRGFGTEDGHPRYAATNGMAELAGRLAAGLDVRTSVKADSVRPDEGGWTVSWPAAHGAGPGRLRAEAVVLTAPVPQIAALLADQLEVPAVSYTPTISLMVALAASPGIPDPGGVQIDDDPIWSWIGDNQAKGTSRAPAVTFHTRSDVAQARWDQDQEALLSELLAAASPWLGRSKVVEASLHRWRYATPVNVHPERCVVADGGRLVLAGDAFGGPRVEGAFLSGLAAAEAVTER